MLKLKKKKNWKDQIEYEPLSDVFDQYDLFRGRAAERRVAG